MIITQISPMVIFFWIRIHGNVLYSSSARTVADNRLPSLSSFFDSLIAAPRRYAHLSDHGALLESKTADVLSNLYVMAPIAFCIAILFNRFLVAQSVFFSLSSLFANLSSS